VDTANLVSSPPSFTTGTMAEYAVFDDGPAVAHRPAGLGIEHAAALPIAGLAALQLFHAAKLRPGDTALVVGATGGVGSAVVPMLAAAGVHVLATAPAADQAWVRRLGASDAVDHRTVNPYTEARRRPPGGVDALVNLALTGGQLNGAGRAVRHGGQLLNIATPNFDASGLNRSDVSVTGVYTCARPGDLAHLAGLGLPSPVSRLFPLTEGPRAYAAFAYEHTRGKLVVRMPTAPTVPSVPAGAGR
jgi:NADPH:quinone reductase-like Zn-dependent oxidoreductase